VNIKALRRVVNWIDFAASLLAAVFLATLVLLLRELEIDPEHELIVSRRVSIIAAGLTLAAVLFIGAILRAIQTIGRAEHRRYLVFETESGHVSISASSVEHAINRAVRSMDEVADASVSLIMPRDAKVPSEASVRCRLFDRPNLLAIQDQVRAAVSDRYLAMFPGQEAVPVRVSIERIVFEPPGPKAPPAPERTPDEEGEEGEQQPFRPQYPVSD
jgi:hypothetical protein